MIVFRKSVGDFLASLNEFTFEAAGIKASAKRKTEAAAALGAAIAQGGGPIRMLVRMMPLRRTLD